MIKEIEQKYDMWTDDFNLDPQDVEWLIEQAERAQDYKTAYEIVDMLARSTIDKANELKQQNKRYREELEELRAMAIDNIDTEQEISPYLLRDICEEILEDEE